MSFSRPRGKPLTAAQVLLGPAPPPWWEDSARLLEFVADRARSDKKFATALIKTIAHLHKQDKRFRSDLTEAITAERPGARSLTFFDHYQALSAYQLAVSIGLGHEERLEAVARLLHKSKEAAEKRLTAARKALPKEAAEMAPPRRRKNQPNRDG
jgi:hypothetical protein